MAYPASLDELTDGVPADNIAATTAMDDATYPHDDHHRALGVAVETVEAELGTNPSGSEATVKARLDALDTTVAAKVPASLVDAAGDLIYATAADTVARLPLGTASQVLTVNSGATAPEWAAASGGAAGGGPTFASGWYAGWSGAPATIGSTEDRAHYVPIPVPRSLTIDRIGIEVTSSATGSPTVRLGVYADGNGVPGALILDAGTVDASTPGFKEIAISQALTAGLVWLACAQQGGTSTGVLRGMTGSTHVAIPAGFSQYAVAAFYVSGVTGALAASAPTMESAVGTAPRIMLRVV